MKVLAFACKSCVAALLAILPGLSAHGQASEADIRARLLGKPLYLRGFWMDNGLKFDAEGRPAKDFRAQTFTEAGIDVHKVKLSKGVLHIEGERMGVEFRPGGLEAPEAPIRVHLGTSTYNGSIGIEIQSPPDGDFGKALDAVFASDLSSMVPSLPCYWQYYAKKNFLAPSDAGVRPTVTASACPSASGSGEKPLHVGGAVSLPVVASQSEPQFSAAARELRFSGNVTVYLWVTRDGLPSHIILYKRVGLGLDEQAMLAVSKYKFKPAQFEGKPALVDLYVEVNFQTQQR